MEKRRPSLPSTPAAQAGLKYVSSAAWWVKGVCYSLLTSRGSKPRWTRRLLSWYGTRAAQFHTQGSGDATERCLLCYDGLLSRSSPEEWSKLLLVPLVSVHRLPYPSHIKDSERRRARKEADIFH